MKKVSDFSRSVSRKQSRHSGSPRREAMHAIGARTPECFRGELDQLEFTTKTDKEVVAALYTQLFDRKFLAIKQLHIHSLRDEEVDPFVESLHRCRAERLCLDRCEAISPERAARVAEALQRGAAPDLQRIVWRGRPNA